MKTDPTLLRAGGSALVQGDDIFFRPEDIQFVNSIADALGGDLTSLELIGSSKTAIDHYGRMLIKRLRQHPNIELEAYLPTGVESLVDQFNAALASISMAEATGATNPDKPVKVFISNELSAGNSRDGRMLSRLVNNFPGANIKLIWVHQELDEPERIEAMEFAGKRAARWYVLTPGMAEAARIMADAKDAGMEVQARALLNKIDPTLLAPVAADPVASGRPRRLTGNQEPAWVQAATGAQQHDPFDERGEAASAIAATPKRKSSIIGILNGVFLVTCLSAIVIAFIFPEHIQAIGELLQIRPPAIKAVHVPKGLDAKAAATLPIPNNTGPLPTPVPAAIADKADTALAAPAVVVQPAANVTPAVAAPEGKRDHAPAVTNGPIEGPTKTTENKVPALPKLTPLPAAATLPATNSAATTKSALDVSPAVKPLAPVVPVAAPASPAPPPTLEKVAEKAADKGAEKAKAAAKVDTKKADAKKADVKKADARKAEAANAADSAATTVTKPATGVNAAPKGSFFVQFVALDSYDAAVAWRDGKAALAGAQIVQIKVEQGAKTKFVVLTGPYRNRDAAEEFTAKKGVPANYWIRAAGPLQAAARVNEKAAPANQGEGKNNER